MQAKKEGSLLSVAVVAIGTGIIVKTLGTFGLFVFLSQAVEVRFLQSVPYQDVVQFGLLFCASLMGARLAAGVIGFVVLLVEFLLLAGPTLITDPLSVEKNLKTQHDKLQSLSKQRPSAPKMPISFFLLGLCLMVAVGVSLWITTSLVVLCVLVQFVTLYATNRQLEKLL